MHEPSDSSLGAALGAIAVLGGLLYAGLGFVYLWQGQRSEGVEGLLFGGLALVAGCVILFRRGRASRRQGPGETP
jgi:hypothetical protein